MPKNKKSAFYYFMKEKQQEYERKGQRIPMSSMPNLVHPIWKTMSVAEKEKYEQMAIQFKNSPSVGILASDGTKVEDNIREEEEKERQKCLMIQAVKNFINPECYNEEIFKLSASTKSIFIISFNLLCRTEDDYIPIEVGLVEYSIESGIIRDFHRMIHPGKIPTGYAGQAKQFSEDKHQISIFEHKDKIPPHKVFEEILEFISYNDSDDIAPFFTKETELVLTRNCLKYLSEMKGQRNFHRKLKVWDLTYLLMELRAGVGEPFPAYYFAQGLLRKTSFDYIAHIRCKFHEEIDCAFCALAFSKRLCYLISDAVCELFDVTITENHLPYMAAEEKPYEVRQGPPNKFNLPIPPKPERNLKPLQSGPKINTYSRNRANETMIPLSPVENTRSLRSFSPFETSSPFSQNETMSPFSSNAIPDDPEYVPRQPNTTSLLAQMSQLNLNISSAPAPGIGIGRGVRRKNNFD